MTIHGSSRGRGHVWLIILAVLGAALVSVLALAQWDSPARAEGQQKRSAKQITLERSADPAFQRELTEASNGGVYEPKIIGGTPVPDGKYPFMAYLEATFKDGTGASCGGTLIDPDSVLTAAHCMYSPQGAGLQGVNVAVGGTVLSQPQFQVRHATAAYVHKLYNDSKNKSYDVAVLTLGSAVTGIKPITLATAGQDALETPGTMLTVAGWGDTSEGGQNSDRMNEASLTVVSDATAQQAYSSQQYYPSLMVAADATGKDSCQGDSGGPLFKPGAIGTQVGIISFGIGCARGGPPGGYTEVNNADIRTFILTTAKK